ncbi:helix-turn-helix domain-containing protein [Sorangium sp. So ce381]|uniref:helix-turn-helix domain-containing protein n=1 Tax=Sorangium sp. So ce381 TaxID=3133307 RepID=UPI003F5C698F
MTDDIPAVPEVARPLKVAEKTVYTMTQKVRPPAFKAEGQRRFRRTDLDAWLGAKTRRAVGEEEST